MGDTLMKEIKVANSRELEDLIIPLLEKSLIIGRLNNKGQVFEVQHAKGRDIGDMTIAQMQKALDDFRTTCAKVVEALAKKEREERAKENKRKQDTENFQRELRAATKKKQAAMKSKQQGMAGVKAAGRGTRPGP